MSAFESSSPARAGRADRRSGGDRRASTNRRTHAAAAPGGIERRARPDVLDTADFHRIFGEARQRFVSRFPAQCDSISLLLDKVAALGGAGPVAALRDVIHRLTGLAGTVGYPAISMHAAALEELLGAAPDGHLPIGAARRCVEGMRDAFASARAADHAPAAHSPDAARAATTVLLAEDDAEQAAVLTAFLEQTGYRIVVVVSGDEVVQATRTERPGIILLDIALPRLDGYSVCRLLKADPVLAEIPVVFMTTGANLDDRLAGLTLGADDFLNKPVDMKELVLRIERMLDSRRPQGVPAIHPATTARTLTYDVFLRVAAEELARSRAALAMVRVPPAHQAAAALSLLAEIRNRDTIGFHGTNRLLILMPGITAAEAQARLATVIADLADRGPGTTSAGVASTDAAGATPLAAVITQADEALADARYVGDAIAIWRERGERVPKGAPARTVLVADDDPEVAGIIDAQMRAAGYQTSIAFDGATAMAALRLRAPDVLVLDLMLPAMNGFEILTALQQRLSPPRVIVLSARGREEDVTRAFKLGADDYMTKPFSPQELLARVARILR